MAGLENSLDDPPIVSQVFHPDNPGSVFGKRRDGVLIVQNADRDPTPAEASRYPQSGVFASDHESAYSCCLGHTATVPVGFDWHRFHLRSLHSRSYALCRAM